MRAWLINTSATGAVQLFSNIQLPPQTQQPRPPKELVDPGGRHLMMLVSDAMSDLWQSPAYYDCLQEWARKGPVVLLHLLPERLWQRSAVGMGALAQLSAWSPGVANPHLEQQFLSPLDEVEPSQALKLPVMTLEPETMIQWAKFLAGNGSTRVPGVLFSSFQPEDRTAGLELELTLSDQERVNRFRVTSSPTARRLAVLMSMVPVSLPIIYLIQQTCLPEATQVHIAEVFMGGLLQPLEHSGTDEAETSTYEFIGDIRAILNQGIPRSQVDDLLDRVSEYIAQKAGLTSRTFTALLAHEAYGNEGRDNLQVREFARITREVLQRLGGSHRAWVESMEQMSFNPELEVSNPLELTEFEFEAAKISFGIESPFPILQVQTLEVAWLEFDSELQSFEFETATITLERSGFLFRQKEWLIRKRRERGEQYIERLTEAIELDMVAIPAGRFTMGSPGNESERESFEQPQHPVTVSPFFIGKTPVTQDLWRFCRPATSSGASVES